MLLIDIYTFPGITAILLSFTLVSCDHILEVNSTAASANCEHGLATHNEVNEGNVNVSVLEEEKSGWIAGYAKLSRVISFEACFEYTMSNVKEEKLDMDQSTVLSECITYCDKKSYSYIGIKGSTCYCLQDDELNDINITIVPMHKCARSCKTMLTVTCRKYVRVYKMHDDINVEDQGQCEYIYKNEQKSHYNALSCHVTRHHTPPLCTKSNNNFIEINHPLVTTSINKVDWCVEKCYRFNGFKWTEALKYCAEKNGSLISTAFNKKLTYSIPCCKKEYLVARFRAITPVNTTTESCLAVTRLKSQLLFDSFHCKTSKIPICRTPPAISVVETTMGSIDVQETTMGYIGIQETTMGYIGIQETTMGSIGFKETSTGSIQESTADILYTDIATFRQPEFSEINNKESNQLPTILGVTLVALAVVGGFIFAFIRCRKTRNTASTTQKDFTPDTEPDHYDNCTDAIYEFDEPSYDEAQALEIGATSAPETNAPVLFEEPVQGHDYFKLEFMPDQHVQTSSGATIIQKSESHNDDYDRINVTQRNLGGGNVNHSEDDAHIYSHTTGLNNCSTYDTTCSYILKKEPSIGQDNVLDAPREQLNEYQCIDYHLPVAVDSKDSVYEYPEVCLDTVDESNDDRYGYTEVILVPDNKDKVQNQNGYEYTEVNLVPENKDEDQNMNGHEYTEVSLVQNNKDKDEDRNGHLINIVSKK